MERKPGTVLYGGEAIPPKTQERPMFIRVTAPELSTLIVLGALAAFGVDLLREFVSYPLVFEKVHYVLTGLLLGGFAWGARAVR